MSADPDVIVRELGKRVAGLRKERGLTQKALAEMVGSAPQWVSQVERGERSSTVRSLVRLARALGVPLRHLFHGVGEPVSSQADGEGVSSPGVVADNGDPALASA